MSGVYASVDRLVEVLGLAAALKFAARFGGRSVYVPLPERLKPEGPLAGTIGFDLAQKICVEWGGQEVMVPKCRAYLAREMARAIHREPKSMTVRAIAEKYDITERYAFQLLAAAPPAEPDDPAKSAQRSLFSET
jgi:Mor family transcriptional regulator